MTRSKMRQSLFYLIPLWFALPGVVAQQPEANRLPPKESREAESGSEAGGEERKSRFEEAIETDRDSFTPATTTVRKRRLIVESAYSYIDNRVVRDSHSFPETLLRFGLMERLELRLGWNYDVGGAGSEVSGGGGAGHTPPPAGDLERESRIAYGLKFRVNDQRRWVPEGALILQGSSPTSGEDAHSQFVGTYVFGWELPNRWKFDSAIRFATGVADVDRFGILAPSAVLKIPVGERIAIHAEYFGILSAGKSDEFSRHYISPGAHFLLTPNLEIGVRVGFGLNEQSSRFFTNAGVGWRY